MSSEFINKIRLEYLMALATNFIMKETDQQGVPPQPQQISTTDIEGIKKTLDDIFKPSELSDTDAETILNMFNDNTQLKQYFIKYLEDLKLDDPYKKYLNFESIISQLQKKIAPSTDGGAWRKKKSRGKKQKGGAQESTQYLNADAMNTTSIYNVAGLVTSANNPLALATNGIEPIINAAQPSAAGSSTAVQLSTSTLAPVLPQTGMNYLM